MNPERFSVSGGTTSTRVLCGIRYSSRRRLLQRMVRVVCAVVFDLSSLEGVLLNQTWVAGYYLCPETDRAHSTR